MFTPENWNSRYVYEFNSSINIHSSMKKVELKEKVLELLSDRQQGVLVHTGELE